MTIAKYETNQILWASKMLQAFLKMAAANSKISENVATDYEKELANVEKLSALNDVIAKINQENHDPIPNFSPVVPQEPISGAMSHITFFQRIMKEGLNANDSATLWQQAYLLWQHVEMREIEPFYAITKLAGLLKEANRLLPEKWNLPPLDLDSYE